MRAYFLLMDDDIERYNLEEPSVEVDESPVAPEPEVSVDKEAPVKDAICLLDKPLSSFNLANTVEKFSIKTNCIQYIYFYTISLNNGGE